MLPNVRISELHALWLQAKTLGLARANIGLISDMIACPGGDFCALANARSLPIAEAINARFEDIDFQHDLGDLTLNISGCINSCGHHHIGNIGILGVDKNDEEFYQGHPRRRGGNDSTIGTVIGPSFAAEQVPDVLATVLNVYTTNRHEDELFIDVVDRLGITPFKAAVYDKPKVRVLFQQQHRLHKRLSTRSWAAMRNLILNQTVAKDTAVLGENLFTLSTVQEASASESTQLFGLLVDGDADVNAIAPLLPHLNLIAVEFPKVVDGRGYSLAYLIRNRLKFTGELRAVGDFTRDQLFYLQRTGFNAMTLRSGEDAQAALAAFNTFTVRYQGSTDEPAPLFAQIARHA